MTAAWLSIRDAMATLLPLVRVRVRVRVSRVRDAMATLLPPFTDATTSFPLLPLFFSHLVWR